MWDLPRPGIKPLSLALPGRFLTIGPPRKSRNCFSFLTKVVEVNKENVGIENVKKEIKTSIVSSPKDNILVIYFRHIKKTVFFSLYFVSINFFSCKCESFLIKLCLYYIWFCVFFFMYYCILNMCSCY